MKGRKRVAKALRFRESRWSMVKALKLIAFNESTETTNVYFSFYSN
jgi:hypothetical protein